jgi:DNA-binding winged helix-turn-helix (wHTH) protein/tetratricopeptide (TPR) repeat protein
VSQKILGFLRIVMSLLIKHLYRFGPFCLDAEQRLVRREGTKIALPPKAFDLLLYMVKNPLRLLTKEELLHAVWPDSFVEEGNLSQNIFLLRRALATQTSDSRYIVTVPGRGYQFAYPVEMVPESTGDEAKAGGELETVMTSVHLNGHAVVAEEMDNGSAKAAKRESEVKRTTQPAATKRFGTAGILFGLLMVGAIAGGFFLMRGHRARPSSRKIVMADFDNRTGDAVFDVVLRKALEIDLGQSPYMDVMSERQSVDVLRLMGRKPDAGLTAEMAAEICQRSNRQVMLEGSIANLGHDYLLTLQATDCVTGAKLAEAKAEADRKEKVLGALDSAAERLRKELGESGQSVERFEVPIAQASTSSLEALKAYSIGEYMVGRMGKEETETLPMFQRAVELDPQFAMAYVAIATDYYNLSEYNLARPYYKKAFDLSGQVSEKEKLYIRAHYYADDVQDVEQGIKEYQLWAETYPQDWGAWLDIANSYTQLGQYPPAIAAGERALELDPSRGINYSVLARAYMKVNRFADARSMATRAVTIGKDSYALHATLFELAFVDSDRATMSREVKWNRGRSSEWFSLYVQAFAAATEGKYSQAEELFQAAYAVADRQNLAETKDDILIDQATMEFEVGLPAAARATLKRVSQEGGDNTELVFLSAELGNLSAAERFLAANESAAQPNTLMRSVYVPRLHAEIALQRAKPSDAIAALELSRAYEFADGFTLVSQRGEAYLRSGQPEKAILEYQNILAHQGVDPISPLFPFAHLRLARVDATIGRVSESRSEYQAFLASWKDADQNLPVLLAARQEYAALSTRHL